MRSRKVSAENTTAVAAGTPTPAATARRAMIAESAYYLAEKRGFASGLDQQDWFAAEQLIDEAFGKPPSGGRLHP